MDNKDLFDTILNSYSQLINKIDKIQGSIDKVNDKLIKSDKVNDKLIKSDKVQGNVDKVRKNIINKNTSTLQLEELKNKKMDILIKGKDDKIILEDIKSKEDKIILERSNNMHSNDIPILSTPEDKVGISLEDDQNIFTKSSDSIDIFKEKKKTKSSTPLIKNYKFIKEREIQQMVTLSQSTNYKIPKIFRPGAKVTKVLSVKHPAINKLSEYKHKDLFRSLEYEEYATVRKL